MATHSSICSWRMPWPEEPGACYSPRGHKESVMTEAVEHMCMAELKENIPLLYHLLQRYKLGLSQKKKRERPKDTGQDSGQARLESINPNALGAN